jgi:hypothetical protein
MDTGQEPATKHDLGELEQRLTETIRDASTNVLRAFYGFAESTQKHLTDLDGCDGSLRERLNSIESRLFEVEKRLRRPPAA